METLLAWAPIVLAIFAAGVAWGAHSFTASQLRKDMQRNHEEVKSDIKHHDQHHGKHFNAIGEIENRASAIDQQLKDHEKLDDSRFERIEGLSREMRDDIKELLRRNGGPRNTP